MKKYISSLMLLLLSATIANANTFSDYYKKGKDKVKGKVERFKEDPMASLGRGKEKIAGYSETVGDIAKTGQDVYGKFGETVFGEEGDTGFMADLGVYTKTGLDAASKTAAGAKGIFGTPEKAADAK